MREYDLKFTAIFGALFSLCKFGRYTLILHGNGRINLEGSGRESCVTVTTQEFTLTHTNMYLSSVLYVHTLLTASLIAQKK